MCGRFGLKDGGGRSKDMVDPSPADDQLGIGVELCPNKEKSGSFMTVAERAEEREGWEVEEEEEKKDDPIVKAFDVFVEDCNVGKSSSFLLITASFFVALYNWSFLRPRVSSGMTLGATGTGETRSFLGSYN